MPAKAIEATDGRQAEVRQRRVGTLRPISNMASPLSCPTFTDAEVSAMQRAVHHAVPAPGRPRADGNRATIGI